MWHFIVFGVTNGRHFVLISRVYEQHPASRLETKHQTAILSLNSEGGRRSLQVYFLRLQI